MRNNLYQVALPARGQDTHQAIQPDPLSWLQHRIDWATQGYPLPRKLAEVLPASSAIAWEPAILVRVMLRSLSMRLAVRRVGHSPPRPRNVPRSGTLTRA